MATCDYCGKEFNKRKDAQEFEEETCVSYKKIKPCLCAECAIDAINSECDGVYFEKCVECGKTFDVYSDGYEYQRYTRFTDSMLMYHWDNGPLCCECALEEESIESNGDGLSFDNDIPEACEACGGPYPICVSGCKLFDD